MYFYVIFVIVNMSIFPLDWIAKKCHPSPHITMYTRRSIKFKQMGIMAIIPFCNVYMAMIETPILWVCFVSHVIYGK